MYTTAIALDHDQQTYSITCRDIKRSRGSNWKRLDKSTVTYSENGTTTTFKIFFEGGKVAAEKNKHRFEDAFEMAGYKRVQIKQ